MMIWSVRFQIFSRLLNLRVNERKKSIRSINGNRKSQRIPEYASVNICRNAKFSFLLATATSFNLHEVSRLCLPPTHLIESKCAGKNKETSAFNSTHCITVSCFSVPVQYKQRQNKRHANSAKTNLL